MICTTRDGYFRKLINTDIMISWKIVLTDDTIVYGDYDRPGMDNPWNRLKKHCEENNVIPKRIKLHMFGAERKIFFEDESGLDGVFVLRGVAKDQAMDGGHSQSFQTLTAGLLRDDCSCIDISKYTWPHNNFEQKESTRLLTSENLNYMIFKNGSKKLEHPEVQKHLDWSSV